MTAAASGLDRPLPSRVPSGRGEVVLVVDDDPLVLSLTERVLARLGYKVMSAADGLKALELVKDASGPIDLLLTDVIMPKQNGPALHECIHKIRPMMKVIYMSGYLGDKLGGPTIDAPILAKPFTLQTLGSTVRAVLDGDDPSALASET